MTYEIGCRARGLADPWMYFVILRIGRSVYEGEQDYTTYRAAVRAAKRTGAKAA